MVSGSLGDCIGIGCFVIPLMETAGSDFALLLLDCLLGSDELPGLSSWALFLSVLLGEVLCSSDSWHPLAILELLPWAPGWGETASGIA